MTKLREHWLLPDYPFATYEEYRRATGECAVEIARRKSSLEILKEINASGLRGRGGAGFPTGTKWGSIAGHPCEVRHVVCNFAEGEPGTFKDRWLLRHNPYALLEGMLIAAHAVGAQPDLYIGMKASFQQEYDVLERATAEINAAGILKRHKVKIVRGPDEYLFGEEKALLEVIEGNLPLPREAHYPPYEKGLFGTLTSPNPALVNNAETFAHVPSIIRAGAASFRTLGSANTPGTVILTLSGDLVRPGIYEREAGMTLREVLYDTGGGPRRGRKIKAVLSGVASGVLLPRHFDTPIGFDTMKLTGSGLGSAGFIVYDDTRSMPRLAQGVARFLYVESCNQCSACKHGLKMASEALDELFDPGTASEDDLARALYGAGSAPQGNRCFLPMQGAVLISSLIEAFRDEFKTQLSSPARPSEPILITKIVNFDPETRMFELDLRQGRKAADWTYVETAGEAARGRSEEPRRVTTTFRLHADMVSALERHAAREEKTVDVVLDEIVRGYFDKRGEESGAT